MKEYMIMRTRQLFSYRGTDLFYLGWWLIESTATNTGGTKLTAFVEYTTPLSLPLRSP
ncbi:MAG: hypothetical protein ACJAR1_002547 [Rubritalea sp.]|jgi:hypothetical protein